MDPICHTFVGASLGQAGLKRLTPLATATLLAGANLPDMDGVAYALGSDVSLGMRRGWTHGVLAMAVLPFLLTAVMLGVDAARRRWKPDAPRARAGSLLVLSVIAVLSHPALDWLNSYGIRLLMPFDGRWFYGDAAFIADPWLWLIAGTAVVLAADDARQLAGWVTLGVFTTALVWWGPGSTSTVRAVWLGALAGIAALRLVATGPRTPPRLARVGLVLVVAYVGLLRFVTVDLSARTGEWLRAQGIATRQVAALPVPGNPFRRDIVAVGDGRQAGKYYFVSDAWPTPRPVFSAPPTAVGGPTRVTDAALAAPQMWGLATWLRFPSYDVLPRRDGYRVYVRDVRFWRPGAGALVFGGDFVDLDRDLRPLAHAAGEGQTRAAESARSIALLADPCLASLVHLRAGVSRFRLF
jgi:inner membrane protein